MIRAGGKPLAEQSGNYTQMIQRLVRRSGIDTHKRSAPFANWYSLRRTLADFLDEHCSDADISAVMGHTKMTQQTRDQIFDRGSPTTLIYKRRKLSASVLVGEAIEKEWWPRIQEKTHFDLGLDRKALMHTDADEQKI